MDYSKIKKVINEWDPLMLLFSPHDDEYNLEIKAIKNFIETQNENDVEVVAKQIQNIFKKYFSHSFKRPYEECLEIAKILLDTDDKSEPSL